jgi:hypothetical protein
MLVLVGSTGCGRLLIDPLANDAAGVIGDGGRDCVASWLAGSVTMSPRLLANVNTTFNERNAYVTDDGNALYFSSNRSGVSADLYRATRNGAEFGDAAPVAELNTTTSAELRISITSDGLTAYLSTDRPGPVPPGVNIWMATRMDAGDLFGALTTSGLEMVNTSGNEFEPVISRDALRLYVNSQNDIKVASRLDVTAPFDPPVPISELNTAASECCPALSADERVIVFISTNDVYYATRPEPTSAFSPPQLVPGASAAGITDVHTFLTPDACTLYFSSTRAGGFGGNDIWIADVPAF